MSEEEKPSAWASAPEWLRDAPLNEWSVREQKRRDRVVLESHETERTQEQDGPGVPDEFREMQRLYERFGGEMSEAVLKAWWTRRHPDDELSWDMRRASSTAIAYMEQDVLQVFGAIEDAGYRIEAALSGGEGAQDG